MSKITVPADLLAKIRNFANGGDVIATAIQAILDNVRVLTFSLGVEGAGTANTIRVTMTVTELDGTAVSVAQDVYLTSIPIAGAGTMTIGTKGTIKAGSATKLVWAQTNASGVLEIDVLNASVEDTLLTVEIDNGESEMVKLTFA